MSKNFEVKRIERKYGNLIDQYTFYESKEIIPLSFPDVLNVRSQSVSHDRNTYDFYGIWGHVIGNSEEMSYTTTAGTPVFIVAHNTLSSSRINKIFSSLEHPGDVEMAGYHAASLNEKHDFLDGKLSDGTEIPVLPYSEFEKLSDPPDKYSVVVDDDDSVWMGPEARLTPSEAINNPLLVARAGGKKTLDQYINRTMPALCNGEFEDSRWVFSPFQELPNRPFSYTLLAPMYHILENGFFYPSIFYLDREGWYPNLTLFENKEKEVEIAD